MESQLPRTHGHHYEQKDLSANRATGLHSGVEGEGEGHHEKQSVLKKVKAKAKKIKNTLTKHGHEHDQNHSPSPSHDEDEDEDEEDEDEEMVEDPEIHGAPVYDSAEVRSATGASGGKPAEGGSYLNRPSMVGPNYDSPIVDPETTPFVQWQEDEEHKKHLLKEDKNVPLPSKLVVARSGEDIYPQLPPKGINSRTGKDIRDEEENPDQVGAPSAMEGIGGGIGMPTGFDKDPQGPDIQGLPSPVQVKTIDPAGRGSEEAEGITPVIQSFNKMGISEEKPKTEQGEKLHTGSHVQFAPEPMPHESSESMPRSYDATKSQDIPRDTLNPSNQSSTYTEKVTYASASAASAIADKSQTAKNVLSSKIEQMRGEQGEGNKSGSVTATASDYAHKIAATVTETLAPVYGKVVGVSNTATSDASGLGAETAQESGGSVGKDKGVSVKGYWVEKLKPGEEDKALSTMITESFGKPKVEKNEEVPGGGGGGRSITETISDAVHKREPEGSGEAKKPMGKVTESEEVAKRLGTGEEGSGLENIGSGAGVVNKLTGAIGSWFGGGSGQTQSTPGTTVANENEG